jgi:hypothetical protein
VTVSFTLNGIVTNIDAEPVAGSPQAIPFETVREISQNLNTQTISMDTSTSLDMKTAISQESAETAWHD